METPHTIAAREAVAEDLDEVAVMLAREGISVSKTSLVERLAGEDSGIVTTGDACASWLLDGGTLHVYDIFGYPDSLSALFDALNAVARRRLAAVLTVNVYADDSLSPVLQDLGFEKDWEEPDVRGGKTVLLLGLVREVA